ncbi:MAG TPA: PD-(D/E)XK nuclease family protein [Fimbriimonadaceae bacterium]|nr:PD-(D/E)XK nuclease family protein [Fimbriimonadaceae bacterium]
MAEKGCVERMVFPGSGDRARAVARFASKGGLITALADGRLPVLQAIAAETDAQVCPFGELVGRVLRGAGQPALGLASSGQTKALIGLACQELSPDSALYESGRFDGTHECLADTFAELHRWGYRPEDLDSVQIDGEPHPLLSAVAHLMRSVNVGLDGLGRGTLADRVDDCLRLGRIEKPYFDRLLIDLGPERAPHYEDWLLWLVECGVYVEVLRESLDVETSNWAKGLCAEGRFGEPPEVETLCVPDILSECEWVLRGCLAAREEGVLDHRIAIVVRSRDDYGPLLLSAAARLGVPIRAGLHVPVLTNGFVSFIDACLDVAAAGDVRRVATLIRRSYFGLSAEARREVEQEIREASRCGQRGWEALALWARERAVLSPWLSHFVQWTLEAQSRTATLPEWIGRLRLLLEGGQLIDVVTSNSQTAHRDLRAQASMERSLLDYASAFQGGGVALSLQGFVSLAHRIWDVQDTVLPGSETGIQVVGSADQLGDCDVVFVLGMLEGVFPRRRSEDPIIGDHDRSLLRLATRHEILPRSHDIAERERLEFVHLCALARRRLVLSYPLTGESRDNIPAFYLAEIASLLGDKLIKRTKQRGDVAPFDSRSGADHRLAEALASEPKRPPKVTLLEAPEAKRAIRPDLADEGVDPREIALASECPFRAVARHRIRVFPGTLRDPWRSIWRLPSVAGLPKSENREAARQTLCAALANELDRMVGELDPWQIRVIEGSALRMIDGWVDREFEAREVWPRKVRTGVATDDPELRNRVPLSDKRSVRLVGQIDAVIQIGPYSGLTVYQARRPDLKKVEDRLNAEQFLQGLELLIVSTSNQCVAAEIDSTDGERHLYLVPRLDDVPLRKSLTCRVFTLADAWAPYARLVKSTLVVAIALLERADMEPRPGKHCETCDYGELCRASIEFGEVDDPFRERFGGETGSEPA